MQPEIADMLDSSRAWLAEAGSSVSHVSDNVRILCALIHLCHLHYVALGE
jgi:hypothetical protein